jgi:hypothetical protein
MGMEMATSHELEVKLVSHEAVCAERYSTFITRVDRLEKLMIKTAGALIVGMAGVLMAIILKGY